MRTWALARQQQRPLVTSASAVQAGHGRLRAAAQAGKSLLQGKVLAMALSK